MSRLPGLPSGPTTRQMRLEKSHRCTSSPCLGVQEISSVLMQAAFSRSDPPRFLVPTCLDESNKNLL
ncbi:hypothetical protein WJX77_000665 [Trebouxia sp. C0004]